MQKKEFNIKRVVLERDNFTCQICGFWGSARELSCHHIHYEDPDNPKTCMTLCNRCHKFISLLQYNKIWQTINQLPFHLLESVTFRRKDKEIISQWSFNENVNLENLEKASSWGIKSEHRKKKMQSHAYEKF